MLLLKPEIPSRFAIFNIAREKERFAWNRGYRFVRTSTDNFSAALSHRAR
jgi:hypothetical protein